MSSLQKYISIIFVVTAFMLLSISLPEPAAAADPGEVIAKVARDNLNTEEWVSSGAEPVPGGRFKFYDIIGDLGSGWVAIAVDEPVDGATMQAVLNWQNNDNLKYAVDFNKISSTSMPGYELHEYTASDMVGVWFVLPNYLIEVEIYETGNDSAVDFQTAKKIAGQVMDGLQQGGPASQPALNQEKPAGEGDKAPAAAAGVTGKPLDEPVKVSDTMNIAGVYNGATVPTTFSVSSPHLVTYISTYHWNNARGVPGGTIALQGSDGKVYGPWQVSTRPGQGGVPNAYWEVEPNIVVPAGTYTVIDSDPATWSQNTQSGGKGMGEVRATPHFETTGGPVNDLKKGTSGSRKSSAAGGYTESPAGVGPVGNIPGPSNTTEALVGVAVPGLIATILGAMAGLGGGGGGFTPTAAAPLTPTAGGPAPGAGGTPGTGARSSAPVQEAVKLGRRRPGTQPGPGADNLSMNTEAPHAQKEGGGEPDIFIDTVDMFEGPGATTTGAQGAPADKGLIIDTADEAGIFVQPESGIIIETAAEEAGVIKPDSGIIIETADEAGVFVEPEPGLIIEGPEEAGVIKPGSGTLIDDSDGGILVDTSALEDKAPAGAGAAQAGGEAGAEAAPVSEAEAAGISEESAYGQDGYNSEGFDRDGFDREGFNKEGFDREGFDQEGFDKEGFDSEGFDKEGFDKDGFNKEGFNKDGFDKEGFDQEGFDREGFNKAGFDKDGFNKEGFNKDGFDKQGYDKEGFNKDGFDKQGYDKDGFNKEGFDQEGFNKEGFNKEGFDREGFNKEGFDKDGFDQEGFNKEGFDREGFNEEGFDREGFNKAGFDKDGFNKEGFNKDGFNKQGYDKEGFNQEGFNKEGFNKEGFNKQGFDKEGFNKEGFNKDGFDREGFNREGFDKNGFDREGYGKNGFDREGYNREGYDVNGYDRKGYNRSGYDSRGYDRQGYDKAGFNKEGWDRDGYDRNGFNKDGFDREGYDKAGYDKDGYDRDGYDRKGMEREGYDADGYDQDGFNKNGVDKDGYDREGFNYEGYNREGYDPWGYDKQGYGKDGYHWSGYNADGYNRDGRHWSENPFEGDGNPFNVGVQDPFGEGEVIPFGAKWVPTKPKLGEPYPRTVEKYGPKPWTDEIPKPEPEKPAVPATENTGVIGPEDPTSTLENHELDKGAPAAPEGQDGTSLPVPEEDLPETGPDGRDIPEQQVKTGDSDTFTYTDPETGETSTYEYEKGYTGPRHGDTQILVGKSDGQTYELEFDAVKGKWVNTESGNEFNPDDFDRWQNDLAEDKRRSAIDLEKMAKREDATSKAIDKNLDDWRKLEQMQKAADKYNIGEPGGPGDVDKAIEDLKKDMLDGKELDQEKMAKIRRVIDNRILGKTTADTGERWEEDWFKNLGWALEANAATAKEVVTGEKADGSISWLGITARIMITAATGGGASLTTFAGEITRQGAMDGILTVAEAMYRIKDSIDKGESDFRAVSKALGMVILGEEIGWLAGQAGGKIMGEMLERFPAFTNKAADLLEKLILTGKAGDQMLSRAFGFVSKESAEEAIDQINKRLVDIGGDATADYIKKGAKALDLGVSDSFVDVSKGAGKGFAGSPYDDIATGFGKAPSGSADISAGAGSAASSSDDIAGGVGKAASGSGDDLAKGAGKAAPDSGDELTKGTGKTTPGSDIDVGAGKTASRGDDMAKGAAGTADSPQAPDGPGAPQKTAGAAGAAPDGPPRTGGGGDGPGDPGGRPPGDAGGDGPVDPGGPPRGDGDAGGTLNPNARTPEEVLADPAAVTRAENTVRNSTRDFDNLPPARQQELIREQAIYDEYKMQAQERNYNLADKVQRGERISVEDVMEMKADPASMRTLKNLERTEGIGAELGELRTRQVQTEFNQVLDTQVHQPSYRAVEDHLSARYNGAQTRCNTVRTPGTEDVPWNINTDNDVIAERLVVRPDGTAEWVEIPKCEWEDVYYESFARNSGFSVDEAARRFPGRDWANMDDAARYREWANLHEETPMDVFDPMAARDYSNQRTAILNGERPCGPLFDRDGNMLRDPIDAEQLGMMEKHKASDYWNKGETPAEIMRNQTESLEQVRKTANVVRNLEGGTHNMPPNMQEAIRVVNNNNLSPALRAARLRELGYNTPGDLTEKLTSRIGSFRTGNR